MRIPQKQTEVEVKVENTFLTYNINLIRFLFPVFYTVTPYDLVA